MDSKGKVTKVRVFIDRAAITRQRLFEGPNFPTGQVEFSPIPLDADTATFRAHADLQIGGSNSPLKITGVSWSVIYADVSSDRQKALKREVEEVDARMRDLDDAESAENHAVDLLARYAAVATQTLSKEWLDKDPAFDKWRSAFDHLRNKRAELATSRAVRNFERAKLIRKRALLLEEDFELGRPTPLGYRVLVAVDPAALAAKKGALSVEVTYLSPTAQWMPIYDARHTRGADGKEKIALTGIALVRQTTGEEWRDIELTATTARPPLSEPPPELSTLIVVGEQGGETKEVVSTTKAVNRLTGAPAREIEGEHTVEFLAPGKVNVPSRKSPVRIELFAKEIACRSKLEVAPMDRTVAMLVADVENSTGRILLPGKVNIFRGANYSGQARLGFVAPNERFRLPLGTDATLRIRREVNMQGEKKGAITGSVTHTFESRTVIENVGSTAIELVVRDRVPVSRAEEAQVKIVEIDRAMEIQPDTGLGMLPLTLPPHSKREVSMVYRVTAPRGFRIQPPSRL